MSIYCVTCDQTCPGCDCQQCDQCAELDGRWSPAFLDDVEVRPATRTRSTTRSPRVTPAEIVHVKGGTL